MYTRRKVAQPYGFNALCELHKALPCTGFGPSSCPQVSLRRLATMASADSCLSPAGFFDLLPTGAASDRSQVPEDIPLLSSWTLRPDYHKRPCRNTQWPFKNEKFHSYKGTQASPNKNAILPRATAAFTSPCSLTGLCDLVLTRPQAVGLICGSCSSARGFVDQASFRRFSSRNRPCPGLVVFLLLYYS